MISIKALRFNYSWGYNLEYYNTSIETHLISNEVNSNMYRELSNSIIKCNSFIFNVAFISFGGLQLFLNAFNEARNRNIQGRILTSDYLNFTDPKALNKLFEFSNIQTKVYLQSEKGGFHTKSYIFEFDDYIQVYIGSSNITENALLRNIEWNVKLISKIDHPFVMDVLKHFEELWDSTKLIDSNFLFEYEKFIKDLRSVRIEEEKFMYKEDTVRPNKMQELAILNLHSLRSRGEKKGLVIAATATGKTYMSAFDVRQYQPRKMLFLVHREDILRKAEESFKRVMGHKLDTGIISGSSKDIQHQYIFSTVQSMNNMYHSLQEKTFDYIIVDESHHALAESYQNILNHFKPDFLLGMTATPERSDGMGLFSFFENNIALEIRLHDALDSELISPFHYFGITEVEGLDLSDLKENEIKKLSKRLSTYARTDYIIEKMNLYGHDGDKLKCLAFCATIEHAKFMSNAFNQSGFNTIYLTGEDSVDRRIEYTKNLESNTHDSLQIIFTVDIFNEGIDIPSINTVLLLRPTESPIVFVQQIGRGLRKLPDKEFVTILDFIGNYTKNFMMSIALKGSKFYDKDSLKIAIANDFPELPGSTFVQMDEISKERVLHQLDQENFNDLKYLREAYFSFKKSIGNIPINKLMMYEMYDSAPDPLRFIQKSKNYFGFLKRVELYSLEYLDALSEEYINAYQYLTSMLPLKRSIEHLIISLLIKKYTFRKEELFLQCQNNISNLNIESFEHALNNLLGKYLDLSQLKRFDTLISVNKDFVSISSVFEKILKEDTHLLFDDLTKYGLTRFTREFSDSTYHVPFLKLYETYKMIDLALLSNLNKKYTSFRGRGILKNGNDYFLFIELNKEGKIKESIKYKDQILDRNYLQWASMNSISIGSPFGRNIIYSSERNINLHIFVRKFKKIDGVIQPYIYLGKAKVIDYKDSKPIHFRLKLLYQLPVNIFNEFNQIINNLS